MSNYGPVPHVFGPPLQVAVLLSALGFLVTAMPTAAAFVRPADTPAGRFLAERGFDTPPAIYREALDAFLAAEAAYRKRDYAGAGRTLDALWAAHPPGTDEWARAYREAWEIGRERGINVGCPPCYYALRMLTECVRWRRSGEASARPLATATMTVVLVGRSSGIEPTSLEDLRAGRGTSANHTLERSLTANGNRILHDSVWLFVEYMRAASNGRLAVRVRTCPLTDVEAPVAVTGETMRFAGLAGDAWERIWSAVPAGVRASTDWWWVIYPSCVPESHPDFARSEFITGGMGSGPDGASPCFIIDDRWLTRKPPHIGLGPYSDLERRAYLPQWLQHEFMHHLFRIYPQFELETKGHQWFDRRTWPDDFQGRIEPDYYAEAMAQRFQPLGEPPLHVALRNAAPSPADWRPIKASDMVGDYRHEPVENDWHIGSLKLEPALGPTALRWTNHAGATWIVGFVPGTGMMHTGPDCPYYDASQPTRNSFRIRLRRDARGRYVSVPEGFQFGGGFYRKQTARSDP